MNTFEATQLLQELIRIYGMMEDLPNDILGDINGGRLAVAQSIKTLAGKIDTRVILTTVEASE